MSIRNIECHLSQMYYSDTVRRAIRRVDATEELLRQLNNDETLEARITNDFPISPSGAGSLCDSRIDDGIQTPDELKGDNPWSDPKPAPASPARSDDSDYGTIPSSIKPAQENFNWFKTV